MYLVGKLDIEIYSCISSDIVTDEVIITDNQVEHIKKKHSVAYDDIKIYLNEAIADF